MKILGSQIKQSRVLFEDADFVTLEICKDPDRELSLDDKDQFLTVVFVKPLKDGLEVWNPWE